MAQQTAIEWLVEQFQNTFSEYIKINPDWEVIEQAKAMEKEQIMNAVNYGDERGKIATYRTAEQYYNETYNK